MPAQKKKTSTGGPAGGYLTPKKTQTDRLDKAFDHRKPAPKPKKKKP